jgi:hypothetical protein
MTSMGGVAAGSACALVIAGVKPQPMASRSTAVSRTAAAASAAAGRRHREATSPSARASPAKTIQRRTDSA